MVDRAVAAAKIAAVRDAVERIRTVLPPDPQRFLADRTAREVVVLNLFVALQDCLSLAVHWLADEGHAVPQTHREVFLTLARQGILPSDLAQRLAAASGLRNLLAHQYGSLDWNRIHAIAASDLDDLLAFAAEMAGRTADRP